MNIKPQNKPVSLSAQIKREIGNRILICFCLIMVVVLIIASYDLISRVNQLENNLAENCHSLESFTISQVLINNKDAIQLRLDNLNQSSMDSYTWLDKKSIIQEKGLTWHFPVSWEYTYPIFSKDGTSFGEFIVKGSLLYNHMLLSELLTKIALLFVFLLIIFIVLYPLSKKIPEKLFIAPICNILALLRNEKINTQIIDLSLIPIEIKEIREKIIALLKDAEQQYREAALEQIAAQVAHDIRSPLTALEVVIKRLPEIEETKRLLLRDAINHIRDITHNLEKTSPDANHEYQSITNIGILLDYVMSERRAAFTSQPVEINHDFETDSYKLFIDVIPSEMKRVLTNIINNACEAVLSQGGGIVKVSLMRQDNYVVIIIKDNGVGIPEKILPSLFTRGVTTKSKGSGLGLFSAKESLAKWGGTIELVPEARCGTSAYVKLPLQNSPSWFISALSFLNDSTVVCVDDSTSIWQAWQERFNTVDGDLELLYCSSKEELIREVAKQKDKPYTFLLDYEFSGSNYTGLELIDIILASGIPRNRIFLVTSRSNESEVQALCTSKQIYMIPKFFALRMELNVIKTAPKRIVLISAHDYQALQVLYPNCHEDTLFYQDINNFLSDVMLFDQSSKILISTGFRDATLEAALNKWGLSFYTFHNSHNLITHYDNTDESLFNEPFMEGELEELPAS